MVAIAIFHGTGIAILRSRGIDRWYHAVPYTRVRTLVLRVARVWTGVPDVHVYHRYTRVVVYWYCIGWEPISHSLRSSCANITILEYRHGLRSSIIGLASLGIGFAIGTWITPPQHGVNTAVVFVTFRLLCPVCFFVFFLFLFLFARFCCLCFVLFFGCFGQLLVCAFGIARLLATKLED